MLEDRGYQVLLAPNGAVALKNAARAKPNLILLDIMMPEIDGYEVCRRLKADPETEAIPVIFCTARDLNDVVVRGFELGAVDYVVKPFQEQEVLKRVETHVRLHRLTRELRDKNAALEEEIAWREKVDGQLSVLSKRDREQWGIDEGFIGKSATIQRIFDEIRLLRDNPAMSVLITGESGTGKELIARAIHDGGPRHDGPFLPLNCAALPRELAESLLFGHVKGAFTGASESRAGCFEAAHGGTLFLDEIGEMPQDQQAKLLRVLEDGQVWRVGATTARTVDVRVVAATNIDLQARISEGGFRQDLFYRLARFTVTAPPLRERPDDIPLLAEHFARAFAADMGREPAALTDETVTALRTYGFPGGNVRELKNVIERALLECGGGAVIEPGHLRFAGGQAAPVPGGDGASKAGPELPLHDLDEAIAETEKWVVARALAESGGNVSAATRLLGTNRNRMYRILGQKRDEADEGDAG